MNDILAFDIGGANIKAANPQGATSTRRFAMWRHPEKLAAQLAAMLVAAGSCESIAVTMTGELADCFASKHQGVSHILDAVAEVAGRRRVMVYLTDGTLAALDRARELSWMAAASNWHALANWATRLTVGFEDRRAIVVDVGSTTCDIIPIRSDHVTVVGKTDTQRLLSRELVYAGVERTPICAIAADVPYRGLLCPVARELFATTLDVFLLTGEIVERPNDTDTADGRPATRDRALARLARCICADHREFDWNDGFVVADYLSMRLNECLMRAVDQVRKRADIENDGAMILSGHGDFLARQNLTSTGPVISLRETLGYDIARCAPAYALAHLAADMS